MTSLIKQYNQKKLLGQVYTPIFIVQKILDDIGYKGASIIGKKILDPACGDGRFLEEVVKRIIHYSTKDTLAQNLKNVHGWDIDPIAVSECIHKLNHLIYPLQIEWNIKCYNALEYLVEQQDVFKNTISYDFIVGNPPYIRIQHLDEYQRRWIQKYYSFCKNGSTDIYIAFFELCLNSLSDDGICGLITPNTFFYTETARKLREVLAQNQYLVQITNYHHIQIFEDATTYSAITIFNKKQNAYFTYQHASDKYHFLERNISFDEIKKKKLWQLSIMSVSHYATTSYRPLKEIAHIYVGITTLCDRAYIFTLEDIQDNYAIVQSRLKGKIQIEKNILKRIVKASKYKGDKSSINEYILFPYKQVNGKYYIIPEDELKENYPLTYAYLCSVRDILDKRDNGKPNPVSWYAYGRNQSLNISFGKKILFSPINRYPQFVYCDEEDATFYSGYCIKFNGDYHKLLAQLNSDRMKTFIDVSSRDFRGGWKAYNKKIIEEFPIDINNL